MTLTRDAYLRRHGVVVLAAGNSKRLGRPKALIEMEGETLVHRATRLALETLPGECIVVSAGNREAIDAAVAGLDCRVVACVDAALGMSASLRCGLRSLDSDCAAALIVLVDQPALSALHLCALRDAWRQHPELAAASQYADTIGVPAMLPRSWFDQLIKSNGDKGARELLRSRRNEVNPIAAPMLAEDVDTLADLLRLESMHGSKQDVLP